MFPSSFFICFFQREFNELQKRLVVLGCQLRKTEVSKRTYEVAVEKLTKFAQVTLGTITFMNIFNHPPIALDF